MQRKLYFSHVTNRDERPHVDLEQCTSQRIYCIKTAKIIYKQGLTNHITHWLLINLKVVGMIDRQQASNGTYLCLHWTSYCQPSWSTHLADTKCGLLIQIIFSEHTLLELSHYITFSSIQHSRLHYQCKA